MLAVLANRGEPSTPDDAEMGLVWSSIADALGRGRVRERVHLRRARKRGSSTKHPWSLGGGGAGDLKELLEDRAETRLGNLVECYWALNSYRVRRSFFVPGAAAARFGVEAARRAVTPTGHGARVLRTGRLRPTKSALFPYDTPTASTRRAGPEMTTPLAIGPTERMLRDRQDYEWQTIVQIEASQWFEYSSMFFPDRFQGHGRITFAFVATHNHFVLDRGGKVFKQSAPIIKLPETATEEDHLALLAYLNSSTACFWMKQVFTPKGSTSANRNHPDPARAAYEFAGTALGNLPVPGDLGALLPLAREVERGGCSTRTVDRVEQPQVSPRVVCLRSIARSSRWAGAGCNGTRIVVNWFFSRKRSTGSCTPCSDSWTGR